MTDVFSSSTRPEFAIAAGHKPYVTITLQAGQTAYSERGALMARSPSILMDFKTPEGRGNDISASMQAILSGEGLRLWNYTNDGGSSARLVLTPNAVGEIVPIEIIGAALMCRRGAFFAAVDPVSLSLTKGRDFATATLSGQDTFMQRIEPLQDSGATLFLATAGQTLPVELQEGEKIIIDNSSLLAMDETVTLDLEEIGGLRNRITGGEGAFMTSLTGPGRVWLRSGKMPGEDESSTFGVVGRAVRGLIPG